MKEEFSCPAPQYDLMMRIVFEKNCNILSSFKLFSAGHLLFYSSNGLISCQKNVEFEVQYMSPTLHFTTWKLLLFTFFRI